MSNYVYVACLDHDPPLAASDESGQHLSDLPQIRQDIADRDVLLRLNREAEVSLDRGYFQNNTLRFLTQHQTCRLGIVDETGQEHPTTDPED